MFVIQYFEKKISVLSQFSERKPEVNEIIKIKGQKAKVENVIEIEDNKYTVQIVFEKIIKKEPLLKDDKKKRR